MYRRERVPCHELGDFMKEILHNMARRLLIEHCLETGIDCSGTYSKKDGRGFSYVLCADPHSRPDIDPRFPSVARITFHKNSAPTYGWN